MKLQVTNSRSPTGINPLVAKRRYLGRVHEMRGIALLYCNSFLPQLKPGLAENEAQCRSRVGCRIYCHDMLRKLRIKWYRSAPFHRREFFDDVH